MPLLEQEQITSSGVFFPFLCVYFPPWDYVMPPEPSTPAYSPCPGAGNSAARPQKMRSGSHKIFLRAPQHEMSAKCVFFLSCFVLNQQPEMSCKIWSFSKET